MKKYCLLFLLIAFTSCKKQGASPSINIIGKWELRVESGGWSGTQTYPKGNGNIYVFNTRQYQLYSGVNLIKQGTYTLTKKNSLLQNKVRDAILFDNNTDTATTLIDINGNQLTMGEDAYDGVSASYERIE